MGNLYVLIFAIVCSVSCSKEPDDRIIDPPPPPPVDSVYFETFTFLSEGETIEGKIHLPEAYDSIKNLPIICLIDFTEQHFEIAKDEFEKVIAGVDQIEGFDALVFTLKEHLGIDAKPSSYQDYFEMFKNMTSYVDSNYSNNTSRTFIGRGSEAGVVLMTLFLDTQETSVFDNFIATDPSTQFTSEIIKMIENDDFPKNKSNKKLHFSYSISNDQAICYKLISLLNEAQYQWLQYETIKYTNSDYENTYPISFKEGIDFVFNK